MNKNKLSEEQRDQIRENWRITYDLLLNEIRVAIQSDTHC